MSLFTPEFGLVFWMLVVFLILFGILAKIRLAGYCPDDGRAG
ncbi:MAG: hypothetical protein V8R91_14510 [Butyricimonas faecihominis]